jgi:hypothetical protein
MEDEHRFDGEVFEGADLGALDCAAVFGGARVTAVGEAVAIAFGCAALEGHGNLDREIICRN